MKKCKCGAELCAFGKIDGLCDDCFTLQFSDSLLKLNEIDEEE